MPTAICPHCHQPHPVGAAFCPTTGQALVVAQPAIAAAPVPVAPAATPWGSTPPGPQALAPQGYGGVKHSYPLAIQQASLGTAIGLLMKTLPYAGVRFGINIVVTIATIIFWVIALAGGAFLGAKVTPILGWIWIIGWLIAFGFIWRLFLRYFLYLLKAGHIAFLTKLITKGQIGNGQAGMFAYGKRIVTQRFAEVNVLFAVDILVEGVVRAFNRTLDFITGLIPIPALQQLMVLVKAVIFAATTYIDETI